MDYNNSMNQFLMKNTKIYILNQRWDSLELSSLEISKVDTDSSIASFFSDANVVLSTSRTLLGLAMHTT